MRKNCIVCGEKLLDEPLYIFNNMPASAQNLPSEEELENDKPISLNLCQCSGCGLVQFDCEPVSYYLDSTRAGERSDVLIKLRRKQYTNFIEKCHLQGKKIVEIGAGKGGFLKTLKEMTQYSIKEYGIEHNREFVETARNDGLNVVYANPEDPNWAIDGSPFDAFMSFAYPARLIKPNHMLQGIANNLVKAGYGLIMVPSLEHLLENGGFYDITSDHIAYYSKDTFRFFIEKNGFDVIEMDEIAIAYLYAIVRKREPLQLKDIWSDVESISHQIKDFLNEECENGRRVAAWCAGHFSFTVLAMTEAQNQVRYIVDNATFKQGLYAPASHIPIVSPNHFRSDPVDTIIILGPMYIEEIADEIRKKCSDSIKIVSFGKEGLKQI